MPASHIEDYEPETQGIYPVEGGQGRISIGDDVISKIVALAVADIEGVKRDARESIAEKFGIKDLIGRRPSDEIRKEREKEFEKGVVVDRDATRNSVTITVSVLMDYGRDMYELAIQLRNHIRATVEKMTRVVVDRVDVRIVGINVRDKADTGVQEAND